MSQTQSGEHAGIAARIIRGMVVLILFGLFLKVGAFLVNWLITSYYDKGPVLDAFTAVYKKIIFLLIFSSGLKIINPAFMPLFSERLHHDGEKKAWEFTSTLVNLSLLAAVVITGLMVLYAREIVGTLLPEFSAETLALAATLLRWMAPGILVQFFAIQALGILNSYKIFSWPSAAEATHKFVWTAGIFLAIGVLGVTRDPEMAPHVIGASYLAGCAAQLAVLLIGMREKLRLYRRGLPSLRSGRALAELGWIAGAAMLFLAWLRLLDPIMESLMSAGITMADGDRDMLAIVGALAVGGLYAGSVWTRARGRRGIMGRFALLAAPLVVGVLFARFRDLGVAFFQSYTREGNFGVIELAIMVSGLPSVLIAFSLSVAMFPYLCDMATRKDDSQHAGLVGGSLRMIAVTLLPLTAITIVLSAPVMQFIFDRGRWSPEDVRVAGLALAILSTGIVFYAMENVLMQAFFSRQRTVLPTALGMIFSVLPVAALYVLIQRMGWREHAFLLVCASYPMPRALKNLVLLAMVHRDHPLMTVREAGAFFGRLAILCAAVAGSAWAVWLAVSRALPLDAYAGRRLSFEAVKGLHLAAPSLAGLIVFILLCIVLRVEEFQLVVRWVRARGWKVRGQGRSEN